MTKKENRIRAFRQSKGWSLQGLAEAVGTSKSQIDKLEKGDRRLTVDWMVRLAKQLDCAPQDLLPPSLVPKIKTGSTPPLPFLSVTQTRKAKFFLATTPSTTTLPRPFFLDHAAQAYTLPVFSNALCPAYKMGQILFVDPNQFPITGNDIILVQHDNSVALFEFRERTATHIIARQHHPKECEKSIPLSKVKEMHVIVGSYLAK